MKKECDVYYFSDMQMCIKCGACWDANDPYPLRCDDDNPSPPGFWSRVIAYIFGTKAP